MHEVKKTDDGSNTLYDDKFGESLHSGFGALTEAKHIFIENGFLQLANKETKILEIGFGTGLNATLTLMEAISQKQKTSYYGIELFPPSDEILKNFYSGFSSEIKEHAEMISSCNWEKWEILDVNFSLYKHYGDFLNDLPNIKFNLVYFDPFSPEKHLKAWDESFFCDIYRRMEVDGILMTYSSKGIVKQALRKAGFKVKRLAGPPGKRHILQATKFEKL